MPHWRRFIENYKDNIDYAYCMAGMIPDWNKYNDPFNSVSRPAQMGPVWMEAQHRTGVTINDRIWIENPPSSSYPACIAVKTAALQSFGASERYLQAVWKAVMVDVVDVSQREALLNIAQSVSSLYPKVFDYNQFVDDYNNNQSRDAFRSDLRQVAYNKIGRFPTLTFSNAGKGLIMTGFRPYDVLIETFKKLLPESNAPK